MTTKVCQAKDIPDERVLQVITALIEQRGLPASLWDLKNNLPFPPKVVLAKLRSLVRRGVIDGCDCGCRGDFKVVTKQ